MPELPEVETIVRQLRTNIIRLKIRQIEILRTAQWKDPEMAVRILTGNQFMDVRRRAKFILFDLADGHRLIIHLRMTGKLIWSAPPYAQDKFTRTIFHFEDGNQMLFNDTRALGRLEVLAPDQYSKSLEQLGIEPLSDDFNRIALQNLLSKSKLEIKDFLLDQKKIAGIGNIYASEILFRSRIHPKKTANSLTSYEVKNLFRAIPEVLSEAVSRMGTTLGSSISDYRTVYNTDGDFQLFLRVYDREGEACCTCGHPIVRIVQKTRSSYFCEKCQ